MTENMKINSVKLVQSGLKGIVVTYANPSNKDNRTFIDEHVSKKRAPIHEELETNFESLRRYLLDICGYESNIKDEEGLYNISRTEITGITYNYKGFVIIGKYKILGGDKTINLVTPLLKDGEEFSGFQDVCVILDNIYKEVKSYMSGEKTFSDEQLVLKFNTGKEGFDENTFKALPKNEQYKIATEILEGMGAFVFHSEESPVAQEENLEETLEEEDFDLTPNVREEKPKMNVVKEESKSSLKMVSGEGENFKIVANITEQKSFYSKTQNSLIIK